MCDELIPTRASMLNKKAKDNFEMIVHTSTKRKANKPPEIDTKTYQITEAPNTFNIKQAKHEVIKFGMSGMNAQQKEEAKVQLAISLGAKPKKNKCKNYKELLAEKRQEKEKLKRQLDFEQLGKNKLGKATAKGKGFDRKRRKQKSDLLDSYGKVKI